MTLRFRDISSALRPNPAERHYGCVIADFLRDPTSTLASTPQIAVVTTDGPNRLYRWDGEAFVDVADAGFADAKRSGIGVAAADVDRSGRLALYVLNSDRFLGPGAPADALLMRGADGKWRDAAATRSPDGRALLDPPNTGAGRSVCFIDFTGDGRPDLYVANYAVASMLYVNRGKHAESGAWLGMRNVAPPGEGLGVIAGGRSLVAADFFNSGRTDLFALHERGRNLLWVNQGITEEGTLQIEEQAQRRGLDDPNHHARGVAVGDFNRDGRLDVVWGNWEGPHRLMMQRDDGTFEDRTPPAMREPSRIRTVIAADFDCDGHLDIFFNNIGQPNRLFLNDGEGNFRLATPDEVLLPSGLGTGATCGDLTGNGRPDLFIAHGELDDQPSALLINDSAPDNHWLIVHALTPEGSPAVGAKVTIRCDTSIVGGGDDERPQMRFIDGGSGYLCQMEPVAHFGLGKATRVAEVTVRWTDGRVRVLKDIAADQRLLVRPQ